MMDNLDRIKKLSGIIDTPKEELQEAYANTPADTSHPDPSEHGDIRDWGENVDTSLRRYLDSSLASPELPQPMTENEMKDAYESFLAEKEKVMESTEVEEAKDETVEETADEAVEEAVEEVAEEETATESVDDNMFARIMQLAGVHKVTEDDINQPEAVEESESSEEETVDEATDGVEDTIEEAEESEIEEAVDEVEETKEEVAEDDAVEVEENVVDEETVAETEQTVDESDQADLDWLKKVIKY
jgi:hypothetical protein